MYKVENSIEYNDYFGCIYVETFDIDDFKVKIEYFYDEDFNGEKRYSYTVRKPGISFHTSGGYGKNNEIIFLNFDSVFDSAIRVVCYPLEENLDKYREIKLNILLDVS